MPNDFYGGTAPNWGDGLNVADLKWIQTLSGNDNIWGTGMDNARRSISVKIDHNLNAAHRLSGTYTYEIDKSSSGFASWPTNSYSGLTERNPQSFVISFTSALKPTLLNEFRAGLSYNATHGIDPTNNPETGDKMKALLQQLMPTKGWPKWDGLPIAIGPGSGGTSFVPDTFSINFAVPTSNPLGAEGGIQSTWGGEDTRWIYADTLTWMRGSHSLKGGAEVRLTRSKQDSNGWVQFFRNSNTFPYVQGGNTANSQPAGISQWTGLVGNDLGNASSGTYSQAYNLMSYMAGSIGVIRQFYFVNSASALTWSDPTKGDLVRLLDFQQREFSFFFKDDWKANKSLTLNLGMRWDYYGVPWATNGMTAGYKGGAYSLFGGTGGWTSWQATNPTFDATKLTQQIFIGPNSPNPDMSAFNKDLNNFGPAVGFAWQLPWFGKGKTILRGGYQASFIPTSTMDVQVGVLGSVPGTSYPHEYSGTSTVNPYLDMTMLQSLIPTSQFFDGSVLPLQFRPVTDRSQAVSVYDPDIRSPYIQSLTLALTRNVGSFMTVDARYIGTLSRKLLTSTNLNLPNFINNGLLTAFNAARSGGESDLLNRLILPGTLVANTTSGAAQLRASLLTRTTLATGNYSSLAGTLATTNGLVSVPKGASATGGYLLRNSGTPENFIYANPQFSSANWQTNRNHANYHSMQAQVTMRPLYGLSLQTSYTWSRNLGDNGNITDVFNRAADYGILSSNRSHNMTSYGTYTLPFGNNGLLFRNSSTAVKKIVEGWQMSWIASVASGSPGSVTTTNVYSMWGGSGVDLVRPDLFDTKDGHVSWNNGAADGRYYGYDKYMQVMDPQCASVASSIQTLCNNGLHALALVAGKTSTGTNIAGPVVFQHAKPGVRGSFAPNQLIGPGKWYFDLAMSKNYEYMEGKSINLRVDAQNIFNHATPSGSVSSSVDSRNYYISPPTLDLNITSPFGYIGYKGGPRVFSAKVRLTF
jgi:hypothetical protein